MGTKQAKLLIWCQTASDSRNTASDLQTLIVPQSQAVKIARDVDTFGHSSELVTPFLAQVKPSRRLASGHGVCVQYASGKRRMVRHDD